MVTQKVISSVSQKVDGSINVERVSIVFFNKAILHNFSITGTQGDTLAAASKISVTLSLSDILMDRLRARRVLVDDGLINLITETPDRRTNITRIFKIDKNNAKKDSSSFSLSSIPEVAIDNVIIRNFRFNMLNPVADTIPRCDSSINFKNMQLSDINVRLSRANFSNGKLTARIRELRCMDRCGYRVRSLTGNYSMDSAKAMIENLELEDSFSKVNAKYLSFGYTSGKDLIDFCNKIVLGADFYDTYLDFRSIGIFAPTLRDNNLVIGINGEVKGPVCDLSSRSLRITNADSTYIEAAVRISGLPNFQSTLFDIRINDLTTMGSELNGIISWFSHSDIPFVTNLLPGTKLHATGNLFGFYSDVTADLAVTSNAGNFEVSALSRQIDKVRTVEANLKTSRLHLGRVLKTKSLGRASLNLSVNGAFRKGEMDIKLTGCNISHLDYNGYGYHDIALAGSLDNDRAKVRLLSRDSSLLAMTEAIVDFREGLSPERLRLYMDVPNADLSAMNFSGQSQKLVMGVVAKADLTVDERLVLGNVKFDNIRYDNTSGSYLIDSIAINSTIEHGINVVTIDSPMLTAEYQSNDSPALLLSRLQGILLSKHLPSLASAGYTPREEQGYYSFHLETSNLTPLCNILMPSLYISKNTVVDALIDEEDNFDFSVESKGIRVGNNTISGIVLSASNNDSIPTLMVAMDKIKSGQIVLKNAGISLKGIDDTLRLSVGYDNKSEDGNSLEFNSKIKLNPVSKGFDTQIMIDNSHFVLNGSKWKINPANISLGDKYYNVSNFLLSNEDQSVRIDGVASQAAEDTMLVNLDNFDISILNPIFNNSLKLSGELSGHISAVNVFKELGILMMMDGTDIYLFDRKVDKVTVMSKWDQARKRFNLLISNHLGNESPLNISGYYTPSRNYLNLNATLKELSLPYLDPFLNSIMTVDGGSISGNFSLYGPLNRLMIKGDNCYIDSMKFTPQYTKVPYILSGPVEISNSNIELKNLLITDPKNNKAELSGNISHNFFKDMYLGVKLSFGKLMALNTHEKDNPTFYGSAYGSGIISVEGAMNDLLIDANITTNPGTKIHVPLSSSSSATKSELITYETFQEKIEESFEDEVERVVAAQMNNSSSKVEIRAKANITQDTEVIVEIDKALGNILRCTGNGAVDVTVNPSKNILDLRGDYTIAEGGYHFVASIASRDLIINEGGTLSFNGDLNSTTLDVGATYRTKASISALISDTTSVSNRRNVDCSVNLKGSLSNPEFTFNIDIPDLDPITKGRVESALSTPDKVQKQFMMLLLMGSFMPDEQSGIVNNTTILFSNISEILSNQVNNIFRQMDIPIDLGLNYQRGSTGQSDIFDFNMSYQITNRLVINGNVGNKETTSSWGGDAEVQYKIDNQGKLLVTAFTRSSDSYSNYLDNTQRHGFGITFQDEFDTWGDFWRNIFYTKKRKEEYELKRLLQAQEELKREAEEANIKKEEVNRGKEDPQNITTYDAGVIEYKEE